MTSRKIIRDQSFMFYSHLQVDHSSSSFIIINKSFMFYVDSEKDALVNNLREKDAKLGRLRRCQRAVREAADQRRRALRRRLKQRRELRGELLELTAEWRTETLQCERCGRLLQIMPQRALRCPAPLALDEPSVESADPNLGRRTGSDGRGRKAELLEAQARERALERVLEGGEARFVAGTGPEERVGRNVGQEPAKH